MQLGAATSMKDSWAEENGQGRTGFFCVRTKLLLRSRCTEVNKSDKTLGREPRERVRHISSKFDRPS